MVDPVTAKVTQSFLPLYPALETFQARPGCTQHPEATISKEMKILLKGADLKMNAVQVTSKGR